ncbi:nuclear transport factor 2 family protein [Leisingera sp. ANG-Vp]|uniref:nuclear transport factor 2 family protein n=1 Tax=Leisingera sp. ANG-Vp TaxID=1577896 RepID=UPI00057F99C3|nr:nuclear transport factor 2 family protein [Leisingera sp. ANG-Vp]KIC19911.1 hypothetical protein RA20_11425 [Leisingera sp. ANG-Vp]
MLEDPTAVLPKDGPDTETGTHSCLAGSRALLLRWIEALGTKDIDALLALYSETAILVPAMQNYICRDTAERRAYFEKLLANPGLTCQLNTVCMSAGRTAATATAAGHYTFSFERDGEDEIIPARFLYCFEEIGGVWLIASHHSSKFV